MRVGGRLCPATLLLAEQERTSNGGSGPPLLQSGDYKNPGFAHPVFFLCSGELSVLLSDFVSVDKLFAKRPPLKRVCSQGKSVDLSRPGSGYSLIHDCQQQVSTAGTAALENGDQGPVAIARPAVA